MRPMIGPADVESWGIPPKAAKELAAGIDAASPRYSGPLDPRGQERLWLKLRALLLATPKVRWRFAAHLALYRLAYEGRRLKDGPGPAWVPSKSDVHSSNIGKMMAERRLTSSEDLRRWSVDRREEYWSAMIRKLGIVFRTKPTRILTEPVDPRHPEWLAGAQLNIAESCFNAAPNKTAIIFGREGSNAIQKMTYGQLHRLSSRIANGLDALGLERGERIALFLPMTPEAVAAYLGIVLSGRCVVGIADAAAPPEFAKRARIAGARAVFTVDSYLRDGKVHEIYAKVIEADGPQAVVISREGGETHPGRNDIAWADFLSDRDTYDAVPGRPSDYTNILFSSGTTKDPKAIPWTQTTPIKSAADAYLHQDVRPSDVLAWPTSFGWMMGPWLTYASLVNKATMALYVGATTTRAFGEFVAGARVTMLGVVPKLVRSWKTDGAMEGLDWHRIRVFSSTAEPSTPDEMLYLMFLAGYRPIVEYCGGTEIGGGYITGTVVQPCAPSMFTTPALGLELEILDGGRPAARGEVFLVPPSIGLSTELLNYDNDEEYYDNVPKGVHGEVLRRHGDQIERLGGGYYRHLGRIDDMININGVKTSSEEIRSVLRNELVYDSKPIAVDIDRSGQHRLVVYAVPRDPGLLGSDELRTQLRLDFQRAIKENLNPLLAHVEDVVLVSELPQTGPGKTRTMKELRSDYAARTARA
jgi:acetyl-CoA synthetase